MIYTLYFCAYKFLTYFDHSWVNWIGITLTKNVPLSDWSISPANCCGSYLKDSPLSDESLRQVGVGQFSSCLNLFIPVSRLPRYMFLISQSCGKCCGDIITTCNNGWHRKCMQTFSSLNWSTCSPFQLAKSNFNFFNYIWNKQQRDRDKDRQTKTWRKNTSK